MQINLKKILRETLSIIFFQLIYGGCITALIYLAQEKMGNLGGTFWLYILIGQAVAVPVHIGVQIYSRFEAKRNNKQQKVTDLVKDYVKAKNKNKYDTL